MKRFILTIILTAFVALTVFALWHHSYWSIITMHFKNFGGAQVFFDLVISLCLIMVWLWGDARAARRNPWPWLFLTFGTGSIGPMIYLLVYKTGKSEKKQ